jgi:dTDP-N-acetylfucosamine:lipid II N-acetylfucosaminyltransferase
MNLHILPDSKFSQKFYSTIKEISLLSSNKFIVVTPSAKLQFVQEPLGFAKINSPAFINFIGQTYRYDRVFIHQFSPLLYRWVAQNSFKELNWMIWGGDLYNLPDADFNFYEEETRRYIKKQWISPNWLYHLKVLLTNSKFKDQAYSKVSRVFTWMNSEYQFASDQIPSLKAKHEFFFYENETAYHEVEMTKSNLNSENGYFILGNSGTPTNNHLDAIKFLNELGVKTNLIVPVSYGEAGYIKYIKSRTNFYKGGRIEFLDKFMSSSDYMSLLKKSEGLIMNNIRPQGYGNIFLMMALGKPVFLNSKNISVDDLTNSGLVWNEISAIGSTNQYLIPKRDALLNLLSHSKLIELYGKYFS